MRVEYINEYKATHLVSFWGIRCYFDIKSGKLWGTNWLNDKLIPVAAALHNIMSGISEFFILGWENPGFPLKILKDID